MLGILLVHCSVCCCWNYFGTGYILPYPHCILITSSHKIKLWEESATDETVGMQRGCRGLVNLHQGRRVGRKRLLSLWSTGRKDHAPSEETKFKLEMAQSITDAISTGGNGGMSWNNGLFCNELINYAVRIVIHPVVRGCSIKGLGIAWGYIIGVRRSLWFRRIYYATWISFFYLPWEPIAWLKEVKTL